MNQSNTLILSRITIALLNKQKTLCKQAGKTGTPPYLERMYADIHIPTSYTTPICCAVARGVFLQ